ncbi:ABC transporter permease [Cryomorphaceae bacterium 1068]|nr:ABC transporter permease [Cryomorphaceae bacterium 1068]
MNTALFIAKRLIKRESKQKGLSGPIVRIATIGIALGMAVMIVAVAIVIGFQNEIRQKVIGFGSHIQITNFGSGQGLSQPKLLVNQPFYPSLDTLEAVENINQFALKEGVIETRDNIQGVILKGVAWDYNWSFFEKNLKEGVIPDFSLDESKNQLLLSSFLAGRLQTNVGEKVAIYFQNAKGSMSQRNFDIVGIYETGLQDLDEQFVLVHIDQIKRINQWGLEANLKLVGCEDGKVSLKGFGFGGKGRSKLIWSADSLRGQGPHEFCLLGDTTIYVVVREKGTLSDTAFFRYNHQGLPASECRCPEDSEVEITTSGGSAKYYTGGFEVMLSNYQKLGKMEEIIYKHLNYNLRTTTIRQKSPEIFNWLEMLDLNTAVIISLMILISVINMTSALLILIMERTPMIGILRAIGASAQTVQKIFLYQAGYIILLGMIIGNVIGISFCLLQGEYGFLKLDPANYYVSEVPILLRIDYIVGLNIGVFLICVLMMTLPTLAINGIRPSKAIRFN